MSTINALGRIVIGGHRYKVLVMLKTRYIFLKALAASAVKVFGI
jgi:hypothetical protein